MSIASLSGRLWLAHGFEWIGTYPHEPSLEVELAVIAGGGAAGVQGAIVIGRAVSTTTTGGLANPLVSILELAGATITSILAVVAPIIAVAFLCQGSSSSATSWSSNSRQSHARSLLL